MLLKSKYFSGGERGGRGDGPGLGTPVPARVCHFDTIAYNIVMDEQGQALAEYALLAFFLVAGIAAVFQLFLTGLSRYFHILAAMVALPVP